MATSPDILLSNTIDSKDRNITPLTDLLIDRLGEELKVPDRMIHNIDQSNLGLNNLDLFVSIIYIYSFYTGSIISPKTVDDLKELLIDEYGLTIINGLRRGEVIKFLADKLGMKVFSFELQSDLHDKVMNLGLPYNINMGISEDMVTEYNKGSLSKGKYPAQIQKSFVGYNKKANDTLNVYNTFGKRLNGNSFKIEKPTDLINNLNLSNTGYVFFPKDLLGQAKLDFIMLNQGLSYSGQESIRRGMWNGKNPQELVTRDMLAEYILENKKKNYLQ